MNPVKKILYDNSKDRKMGNLEIVDYPNQYYLYDDKTGKRIHPDEQLYNITPGTREQKSAALKKRWEKRQQW